MGLARMKYYEEKMETWKAAGEQLEVAIGPKKEELVAHFRELLKGSQEPAGEQTDQT